MTRRVVFFSYFDERLDNDFLLVSDELHQPPDARELPVLVPLDPEILPLLISKDSNVCHLF